MKYTRYTSNLHREGVHTTSRSVHSRSHLLETLWHQRRTEARNERSFYSFPIVFCHSTESAPDDSTEHLEPTSRIILRGRGKGSGLPSRMRPRRQTSSRMRLVMCKGKAWARDETPLEGDHGLPRRAGGEGRKMLL